VRLVRLCFLSLAVLACTAQAASASATIGQLLPPYAAGSCGATVAQTAVETGTQSYAVPAGGGVITSWQTQTGPNAGKVKLKVFRATANPTQYLIVGEEGPHNIAANTSPSFSSNVRVPVQGGDLLGLNGAGTNCTSYQAGKNGYHSVGFGLGLDPLAGSIGTVEGGTSQMALEITATIEPDADHDNYGDETQDVCLNDPGAHALPCTPPPVIPPPPDTTPPSLKLSSKAKQAALKAKAVIVVATSTNEAANLKASGSVSITGGSSFSLIPSGADIAANVSTSLSLAIPKEARAKIKKALKEGRKVRASVHVVAKDAAGNVSNANQTVAIVKPPKKKPKA
jgi:hypothetical protein